MNIFLRELSKKFPDILILLCVDNAGWHKSKDLVVPSNIKLFYLPPRTPEMNPIELMWREIRRRGFKNVMFKTIEDVVKKFEDVVAGIVPDTVKSVTLWPWVETAAAID